MQITVEWEHLQRRRMRLDVPDDASSEQITELVAMETAKGRAGRQDDILADAIGSISWKAPDGRFGGRVQ